jgi:hypothetical protein
LFTATHTERIENASDDLIANTRKVADTSTADKHNRVLLQVMPFTRDVSGDFFTV